MRRVDLLGHDIGLGQVTIRMRSRHVKLWVE